MKTQKVKIRIEPREHFKDFLKCKKRWFTLVAHRRAGKTVAVVQKLIAAALTHQRKGPPLRYAYIAPTRDQAKDIAWQYLKDYTSGIPGVVVNEAELRIVFPNKAQIRLYSGENYERMRGLYFDGVVSDEDADINPNAFTFVIMPCLLDYDGWHCRIGTPKGKNSFYKAYQRSKKSTDHYALKLQASKSGILSESSLNEIRAQVTQDAYDQEMECDFNVGRPGSIYADVMADAYNNGRVFDFDVDPESLVHTSWDLGAPENMVVVYWQIVGFTHRIIDVDHFAVFGGKKITTAERVAHMMAKGYPYGNHYIPHDSKKLEYDGMSFETKLRKAGLAGVRSIPRETHRAEEKRIRTMGDIFSTIYFRESTCGGEGGLIDALENYHRKLDRKTNRVTDVIVHDWCSHFCDAFGYWGEALKGKLVRTANDFAPKATNAETPARAVGGRKPRQSKQSTAQM